MLSQPKRQLIEDEEVSVCKSCRARPYNFTLSLKRDHTFSVPLYASSQPAA